MSLRLKQIDRCMCPDFEETCNVPLNKLMAFYSKQTSTEFLELKNLERFGISLFNLTHSVAIELIALLLDKLSDLFKDTGATPDTFQRPIALAWESLQILFNRLELRAQKGFLTDLERCFKDTHKHMQGIIGNMSEGQGDIDMWRHQNQQIKHRMEQLKQSILNYNLEIDFKELSAICEKSGIKFQATGSIAVSFFLLGAIKFIYILNTTRKMQKITPKWLMNSTSNLMTDLLILIKGHDIKYLACIEMSLERDHKSGYLTGFRNIVWGRKLAKKNSFVSTIEKRDILYLDEHQMRIRERLLKITTRFQLGNLVDRNSINLLIKSLHCLRRALKMKSPPSDRDHFYFRYVSILSMWREKCLLFNENSKLLPLFVRELSAVLEGEADLYSRFPYTLYTDFQSGAFLATTTKYLQLTAKLMSRELRVFELHPIKKAIKKKLGDNFLEQRSLSRFSESSESGAQLMMRHGSNHSKLVDQLDSLSEAKRVLRQYYKSFIKKMDEHRIKIVKSKKAEYLASINRRSKSLVDAVKSYFHFKPAYPYKEDFSTQSEYLEEMENSLNLTDLVVDLTYRCVSKQQPQVQLLCYLVFPSLSEYLESKGKHPFSILKGIMGPQLSGAIVMSDTALESHFSFQLGFVDCVGRYKLQSEKEEFTKRLKYFKSKYQLKNTAQYYLEKAKEFFLEEAQFLEDMHCKVFRNTTPPMCAFFYATYALGNLEEATLSSHDLQVARFYKVIVELYPLASVLDMLWRMYWLVSPVLGKANLLRHLKISGDYLVKQVWNKLFSVNLMWGEELEIDKERKQRKKEEAKKSKSLQAKIGAKRSLATSATRQTQLTEMFSSKRAAQECEPKCEISLEKEVYKSKTKSEQDNIVCALKSYLRFGIDLLGNGPRIEFEGLWFKSTKYCWNCHKFLDQDQMYKFNEVFIYCGSCQAENVVRVSLSKPQDLRHEIAERSEFKKLKYLQGKKKIIHLDADEVETLHNELEQLVLGLVAMFDKALQEKYHKMIKCKEAVCTVLCRNVELSQLDQIGNLVFSFLQDLLLRERGVLKNKKKEITEKVTHIFEIVLQVRQDSFTLSNYFNELKEKVQGSLQLLEEPKLKVKEVKKNVLQDALGETEFWEDCQLQQ